MPKEIKTYKKSVKYSPKIMEKVCSELLFSSRSIKKICKEPGNPTEQAVMKWIKKHPEAHDIYVKHKEMQMHWLGEEVIEISDGIDNEKDGKVQVERDKLRVQTRLQVMGLLNRKAYGAATDAKIESMKEQLEKLRDIVRSKYQQANEVIEIIEAHE